MTQGDGTPRERNLRSNKQGVQLLLKEITRGQNDTVAEGPGIALGRGHFLGSLKEAGSEKQSCLRDK